MSLNLGWDYLEILLLLLAFGIPVVVCVAIFCCCQHQFNILKSPIICQKCLFYIYFEILLLLLLAFGIPVIVCVAIFCSWLFAPTNSIQKSPILCQKCLFFVYFEILLLLLLAFGIPVPVVVCGAIFCCWLLPPPTNWGQGIL